MNGLKAIAEGLEQEARRMKYRLMRRYARAHYCRSTGCWILRLHFGRKDGNLWGENGFFSTHNILIHIPIGAGGYDLSWIEAVGTIAGLLCIWLASLEKISNYFLDWLTLPCLRLFSFRSSFMPACCCNSFLCRQYLWLVCVVAANKG